VLFCKPLFHESGVSPGKGFTSVNWQITEHFCHPLSEATVLFLLKLKRNISGKT